MKGGINAASTRLSPEPGLQENKISLFSICPDFSGFTCVEVQSFCRNIVMSCPRIVVLSYCRTIVPCW
jgi:hypothetical protein